MSIQISGFGNTIAEVGSGSRGLYGELVDSVGARLFATAPVGAYFASFAIRHTAADAALSAVYAMHNPVGSGKTLYVRAVRGRVLFDGTAVAATSLGYHIIRFSGADPTTGTTVPRIKKRNAYANSVIADANIQSKSGILTMTGVAYETSPIHIIRVPGSLTGALTAFDLDPMISGLSYEFLEFAPGEGMAFRLDLAAIIGLGLAASVEWDER